jgi:dihydroorotate dehydrogenase (fumarate)
MPSVTNNSCYLGTENKMADLKTRYMGLELRNPVIVSSSGLTKSLSRIKQCEEAGAGAVVLKSIFEEQYQMEKNVPMEDINVYPEALDYMRRGGLLEYAPQELTKLIGQAKKEVNIPIIASINCQSGKLWPSFARQLQDAGADGLELNIYFLPIDLDTPGIEYEKYHLDILEKVKKKVTIPVSVKLTEQVTALPHLAHKLAESGCDGLVLFNWFLEPDIDVHNLRIKSRKGTGNFHQSLRWVGLLSGRVGCDLASSGGIQSGEDVVKQILAGATAVQVCSLFYQKGLEETSRLLADLESWMTEQKYPDIKSFCGDLSFKKQELSFKNLGEAEAYFRSQYIKTYAGKKQNLKNLGG